ncbi:MAG TPA: transposase [Dokdonella sp.]|nr:transposase [Dokdonella sp.]
MDIPACTDQQATRRRCEAVGEGRLYRVDFATFDHARLFDDWALACAAARTFGEARVWRTSQLLCWVLLPDRWHGLVRLAGLDSLPILVARMKAVAAGSINLAAGRSGAVWARGYHERAVRPDEDCAAIARGIVREAVHAGLCRRVGEYPFWDASWLA